ncbi:MAG: hypothetical protein AAF658_09375, partial [Myxococcota bacterium]
MKTASIQSWLNADSARAPILPGTSAKPEPEALKSTAKALVGQLVEIEGRGIQQIRSADAQRSVLEVGDGGLKLDLCQAAMHGAAVSLEGRDYGSLKVAKPADKVPFWRKFGQSPLWHGVINAVAGNKNVFPKRVIKVDALGLDLPADVRAPSDKLRLFTAEFAFAAYSSDIENACQRLEAKGFKDVRVVERDDALVLLAVDPTESAVVCAFRCATKVHSTLLATDTKPVTEGQLTMPRGMHRYVSRVKEAVDSEVAQLLEKYPDADLLTCGSSLGGGAAVQWVSRGVADGTLDPDRIGHVVVHGATRGVGRERATELREILGDRVDACWARGDWLTHLSGGTAEHAGKITKLGTRRVSPKRSHGLGHTLTALRRNLRYSMASANERQSAYAARNAEMATKYPEFGFIFKDPDAFLAEVRGRFAAQKAKTPESPYDFDFSDHGMVFVEQMRDAARDKIEICEEQLANLLATRNPKEAELSDRELGLKFLREMRAELDATLASGKVTYRQMVEQGYFVSHALSQRDHDKLNVRDKFLLSIDRKMQGQRETNIREAYDIYKKRDFSVFQARSSVPSFDVVHETFEKAFFDPNELQFVYLPTTSHLARDIFIRLALHEIHLGGVALEPIAADGFLRPGYDFWLHDARHASLIWANRERYERANGMSEEKIKVLRGQYDVWLGELNAALKDAPPKIRKAVIF